MTKKQYRTPNVSVGTVKIGRNSIRKRTVQAKITSAGGHRTQRLNVSPQLDSLGEDVAADGSNPVQLTDGKQDGSPVCSVDLKCVWHL